MDRIVIENIANIAEIMYEDISHYQAAEEEIYDANFIGYYDDVIRVIKALLKYDDTFIHQVCIEPAEWDGYDKEYLVTLDTELGIWCEKCQRQNGKYLELDGGLILVADDCNSAVLKGIDSEDVYEVSYNFVDDTDECDGNCECCDLEDNNQHEVITRVAVDENGRLRGFEKSWYTHEDGLNYHSTYSFYSSNEDMLKNMLDNFNIKY